MFLPLIEKHCNIFLILFTPQLGNIIKLGIESKYEDIHNSWLYCFTNPLRIVSIILRWLFHQSSEDCFTNICWLVKQYNQELCISSNSRCFTKRLRSRPLNWSKIIMNSFEISRNLNFVQHNEDTYNFCKWSLYISPPDLTTAVMRSDHIFKRSVLMRSQPSTFCGVQNGCLIHLIKLVHEWLSVNNSC